MFRVSQKKSVYIYFFIVNLCLGCPRKKVDTSAVSSLSGNFNTNRAKFIQKIDHLYNQIFIAINYLKLEQV